MLDLSVIKFLCPLNPAIVSTATTSLQTSHTNLTYGLKLGHIGSYLQLQFKLITKY